MRLSGGANADKAQPGITIKQKKAITKNCGKFPISSENNAEITSKSRLNAKKTKKKALGAVKLSDATFQNPTVSIVKRLINQLLQDEKNALKAKDNQQQRVSVGESLIQTLHDEEELTYAIEGNESIKRLQEQLIQHSQRVITQTQQSTISRGPDGTAICQNQEEAELDAVSILGSIGSILIQRTQELQRQLEQERLEHCYCLRMLDMIKREVRKRQEVEEIEKVEKIQIEYKQVKEKSHQEVSVWDYAKSDQLIQSQEAHTTEQSTQSAGATPKEVVITKELDLY
ncbi:hypothetical protein FGO68_gene10097 [Halteria grandinella]|uniref:Uncharacterized protein n=1 Tax=Halteria grandinella TaxID=5974 RepID=A0A8J8T7V8_HALGN|nr:hypothetical protein FGO68_gene10097 [Halteria grandinella]